MEEFRNRVSIFNGNSVEDDFEDEFVGHLIPGQRCLLTFLIIYPIF